MKVVIFSEELPKRDSKLIHCPAIKTYKIPKKFPQRKYDYLLLTSKNAIRYSEHLPLAFNVVLIGKETSRYWRARRGEKMFVLNESNQKGILHFFKKDKDGKSIFFPRSQIADRKLVQSLKKMNLKVCVRHPYTTKNLPLRKPLQKILKKEPSLSFLISSGSMVRSLRSSFSEEELRALPVQWIAIGPTTKKALSWLGKKVWMPRKTSLKAGLKLALQMDSF